MLHSNLPTPPTSGVQSPGIRSGRRGSSPESRPVLCAPVPPGQKDANAAFLGKATKDFVGRDGGQNGRRAPSRYRLQRFASGLAGNHRGLAVCGWKLMPDTAGVAVRGKPKEGGGYESAHLGHLAVCGSHLCPVCGPRVADVRRGEVAHILAWAETQRLHPVMVTLTTASKLGQPLLSMVEAQKEALRSLKRDRRYKARSGAIAGVISAFETTHGSSGWHPHFHLLLLIKAPTIGRALRLVSGLRPAWVAAAKAEGLHAGRAGFRADAGYNAADYMAKWDLSDEVAKGAAKEGKGKGDGKDKDKGKTPSQLLRLGYGGDKKSSRLWGEYERAMTGKSVLRFSPGLRKMAGVPELFDKHAASEEGGERPDADEGIPARLPLIDIIPGDLWEEAKANGLDRDDLLRAAKEDGRTGIRAYLASLREDEAFNIIE
jgi:hypothetical protein